MNNAEYKRLGDYIREVDVRNRDLAVTRLLGVSVSKEFIPSIANTIGTDMSAYKIVQKHQFVYISDTSRRGDKIAIALLEDDVPAIISQAYTVFEISDKNRLLPEYLMMWFRRPEFDRYARYHSHGSAREVFDWDEMCDVRLPIPPLSRQREIVAEYETLTRRIRLNERLIASLESLAQTLYRRTFVDDIDPAHLPPGWRTGTLGEICEYVTEKISTSLLSAENYISTENMLKFKKGVDRCEKIPENGNAVKFIKGDILISNIRPYFKKIWKAIFDGGCSNDVLCLRANSLFESGLLYYTLERDSFFDYVMSGSNGVKMPREDKGWIMKFPICVPPKALVYLCNSNLALISESVEILRKDIKKVSFFQKFLILSLISR